MSTHGTPTDALHAALAAVAPGTPLRDGLDRVVRAKMGALVVLDDGPDVLAICSGGFLLDAAYSPQRLSELAKMDGAIILSADRTRIARANVHLVPDPTVPTSETGTRHRTAERVARSLGVPVVSVSEEMSVINVYAAGVKHQVQEISHLLERANQALQTLERYKARLTDSLSTLTSLEFADLVTTRDVMAVLQRGEMVHRIAVELETMIVELGVDARLLRLQLDEVYGEVDQECALVAADYPTLSTGHHLTAPEADTAVTPRGLRMLSRIPGLDARLAEAIVEHFGELAVLQRATVAQISSVPGLDPAQATVVKDTLDRRAESAILEQYY